MFGELESRVNHGCRFQLRSQILRKCNIFADIRFPVIN